MNTRRASLWSRLRSPLRQANTWLVIALLALAGWTVDASRMFLTMHRPLWAGLGAFASHFWYAVPMAAAIVVLTFLHPRSRLLGATAYDEAGNILERRGDFHLDNLTAQGMLGAVRDSGQQSLRGIILPSGTEAYFIREGGVTLVLGFSGPVSPRQVAAEAQSLRAGLPSTPELLAGLDPAVAALAANTLSSPLKRELLAFFHEHRRTSFRLDDLLHWAGHDEDEVGQAIEDLVTLRLVQRQCACNTVFCKLNHDPAVLDCVDELFSWQRNWQIQVQRLAHLVGPTLAGGPKESASDPQALTSAGG